MRRPWLVASWGMEEDALVAALLRGPSETGEREEEGGLLAVWWCVVS